MDWLPIKTETLILPYDSVELVARLKTAVRPLPADEKNEENREWLDSFRFNGIVSASSFRISKIIKQPENFLPLIIGQIDNTSTGCILFLKYKLFFGTLFYLIFWSVLTLLLTLFFILLHNNYLYGMVSLGFGVASYAIALANFKIQIGKSKKLLDLILA